MPAHCRREQKGTVMNDFWTLLLNHLVELAVTVILAVITCIVLPWLKNTAVPWMKEKRLYTIVSRFVQAAEKYSKTQPVDKKQWVVSLLKDKGIDLTPEVEAYIESAVQELDVAIKQTVAGVRDTGTPTGVDDMS